MATMLLNITNREQRIGAKLKRDWISGGIALVSQSVHLVAGQLVGEHDAGGAGVGGRGRDTDSP